MVTEEIRRGEAELDQWATASVAPIFTHLSDMLPFASVVKSYRQLISMHYQYVMDIPTTHRGTNVLDQYHPTCLVLAMRCLFWKLTSVTQTRTIIFHRFLKPMIR